MSKKGDYDAVRKDIAGILKNPDYDDGSIGPVLVRLAWHASGTYDKSTGKGGSNGASMRFEPEKSDDANSGLANAQKFLEPIKQKHPWITYADLWTLAGAVAVEEMQGPKIDWYPGRIDYTEEQVKKNPELIPKPGFLPDASQGQKHVREVFYRMGFSDQEIVALMGAHNLGRAHKDRSGFDGPWTHTPTRMSNQFFKLLIKSKWAARKWDGPGQYAGDGINAKLMMLETDMSMASDEHFKKWTYIYAEDKEKFFEDFAKAFGKLISLGVPPRGEKSQSDEIKSKL